MVMVKDNVWGVNDPGPASLARWMASSSRSYMIIAHMLIIGHGLEGKDYDAVFLSPLRYIPIYTDITDEL